MPNFGNGEFPTTRIWGTGNVKAPFYYKSRSSSSLGGSGATYYTYAIGINPSLTSSVYGNSDTVQPASVSILAYMVVGNTKTTQGYSEVVAQGKEILEQVNEGLETRADIRLSNVTPNASFRRNSVRWGIPNYSKQIEIEVATGLTTYIAPYDGVIYGGLTASTTRRVLTINGADVFHRSTSSGYDTHQFYFQVYQGDAVVVDNYSVSTNTRLCFAPFRE